MNFDFLCLEASVKKGVKLPLREINLRIDLDKNLDLKINLDLRNIDDDNFSFIFSSEVLQFLPPLHTFFCHQSEEICVCCGDIADMLGFHIEAEIDSYDAATSQSLFVQKMD